MVKHLAKGNTRPLIVQQHNNSYPEFNSIIQTSLSTHTSVTKRYPISFSTLLEPLGSTAQLFLYVHIDLSLRDYKLDPSVF